MSDRRKSGTGTLACAPKSMECSSTSSLSPHHGTVAAEIRAERSMAKQLQRVIAPAPVSSSSEQRWSRPDRTQGETIAFRSLSIQKRHKRHPNVFETLGGVQLLDR
ncbi:hypothetical protein NDU88_007768 [Pleurodeles waltl]|uniref:Uncharacterized protein n=1 Tax=Pleurodeles waltl TaxID=8319 RepID=A0AAV7STP2_PLEWA|nr:hypothetical protein NDU88_007768 [Pleurodeles waltl]